MPFNDGENVGPYRVMEKLGRGGMATVYKAYHASLDRYVALKVLHPAFLEDPNFLARFQREARVVAKLEHSNIVPIYDFAEHEHQPYLVMKYIEGETLKAHIARGRLSAEKNWDVVNSVGAALSYAHKQGILHRDVKPSNVIVSEEDGRIYLADFGLARIAQSGESTLTSDMIMGTPQYISPEQAIGAKDLDNRTDMYSFAVMLYEMVVGQVPFSSDTPFSVIHDHIYSPLPLPHLINPSVPDEVERVLLKALAKEREDRYIDINALTKAFKKAWDDSKVDMDDVTMTAPVQMPEKTATAIPTHAPDAPTIPPAPAPKTSAAPIESPAATAPKKKRVIWAVIAGGVLLILACIILLSALSDSSVDVNLVADESGFSEQAETRSNRPSIQADTPEIEDALAWVKDSPNDAYAHLELASILFDAKQMPSAYEQLNRALELAKDDEDFYYDAGFRLMDEELWAGAAHVFFSALKHFPPDSEEGQEFEDFFHENLYRAAVVPEFQNILPYDEMRKMDEPMMMVAEARRGFYHGNVDLAKETLKRVLEMKPNMPEVRLLEAEMLVRDKKMGEARPILENLMNDERTPDWIFFMAEESLERMP